MTKARSQATLSDNPAIPESNRCVYFVMCLNSDVFSDLGLVLLHAGLYMKPFKVAESTQGNGTFDRHEILLFVYHQSSIVLLWSGILRYFLEFLWVPNCFPWICVSNVYVTQPAPVTRHIGLRLVRLLAGFGPPQLEGYSCSSSRWLCRENYFVCGFIRIAN